MTKANLALAIGAAFAGTTWSLEAQACAACGCTLATDVDNLGLSASSGFRFDFRYDYLNQNQLRSGTGTISPAAASKIVNGGDPQEVEKYTKNDYITLGLDYAPTADWGVNLQLPYIVRSHATLGTASDGSTPGEDGGQYDSRTSSIGDVRVIGRYQGFSPRHDIGLTFGLKLPTGSHTRTGTSTDPTASGPAAIDRGLQPGTGTTDLLVGAYTFGAINDDWAYSAQGTYQTALNSKDEYRPGNGVNLNLGLRYMSVPLVIPQLQLNLRHVKRDRGAEADTVSTGGTLAYLSPGFAMPLGLNASLFGFVQVPIYQNVNGVQLAPKFTVSVGARYTF